MAADRLIGDYVALHTCPSWPEHVWLDVSYRRRRKKEREKKQHGLARLLGLDPLVWLGVGR